MLLIAPAAHAQECTPLSDLNATQRVQLNNIGGTSEYGTFSCQDVSGVSGSNRSANCIDNACPGTGANVKCCRPGTGSTRPPAPSGGTGDTGGETSGGGIGRLVLPDCVQTGNCGLDDIIQTGVNFANFLFGISGAIFLAIFVYAGILYLTAGGNTSRVQEAKKKLVDATIGMILVVGAGVLVTFIYNAFLAGGGSGGGITEDTCAETRPGFSCQVLPNEDLEATIRTRGCVTGLCTGPTNRVCCPASTP